MSKLEPGQRAYEAYHGVAEFSMRVLTASERRRWAAVEQACAVPAPSATPSKLEGEWVSELRRATAALALELQPSVHRDYSAMVERALNGIRVLQYRAWHEGYDASSNDNTESGAPNPYWREGDGVWPHPPKAPDAT